MMRQGTLFFLTIWATLPLWSQSYNKTNTITKQEISKEIKVLFTTIDTFLEQHSLEVEDFPQFAQIYQAAQMRMAKHGNAVLASYPDDDDISQPDFVLAVGQWTDIILGIFKTLKKDYKDVDINIAKFTAYLTKKAGNDPFPLNKALYKEWAGLLDGKVASMKGEEVFDILLKNEGNAWKLANNAEQLTLHYKKPKNRKIYNSNSTDFRDRVLPQKSIFITAIGADSEDPNLLENKEKNKEKVQELYQQYAKEWYMVEQLGFSGVASDSPNVLISCPCLDVNSTEVISKVIPDSVKVNLLTEIKTYFQKQIGSKNDTAPWHDVASYGIAVLSNFYKKHYSGEEWKNYTTENIGMLQFPTNIARWMWNCNVPSR